MCGRRPLAPSRARCTGTRAQAVAALKASRLGTTLRLGDKYVRGRKPFCGKARNVCQGTSHYVNNLANPRKDKPGRVRVGRDQGDAPAPAPAKTALPRTKTVWTCRSSPRLQ